MHRRPARLAELRDGQANASGDDLAETLGLDMSEAVYQRGEPSDG
ncbi:hypothetical protein OHT20_00445 [Streptomyces caniferus]|nr:hypothetical protein [Streptomyces caniferus]